MLGLAEPVSLPSAFSFAAFVIHAPNFDSFQSREHIEGWGVANNPLLMVSAVYPLVPSFSFLFLL